MSETAVGPIDRRLEPQRVVFSRPAVPWLDGAQWTKAEVQSNHATFEGATSKAFLHRRRMHRCAHFCRPDSSFGMYLLNIDALVTDLRAGRVRVRDALFHKAVLLVLAIVSWTGWDLRLDVVGATRAAALLLCQLFAIYLCYCANGYGSSSARITRFSMVGACIGLRILCFMGLVLALDFPPTFWQSLLGRAAVAVVGLQTIAPLWIACGCSVLWGWRVSVHMERAMDNAWSAHADGEMLSQAFVDRRAGFFSRHDERRF